VPAEEPLVEEAMGGEPAWVDVYRQWIVESFATVRILDMTEALPLDELYIPISLSTPSDHVPRPETVERRFVDIDDQMRLDADWRRPAGALFAGPQEALVEYGRVAIVGDPGAGKTTMLRHLAVLLAKRLSNSLPHLPLVVDLHSLGHSPLLERVEPERLVVAWLAEQIERTIPSARPVEEWLRGRLEAGEAVLLLDGLDEVAGATIGEAGPYRIISRALASLTDSYPDAPVLITCRHAHVGRFVSIPKNFQVLETCDFEWEHVNWFLDVWFRGHPDTGKALKINLKRNIRIRGLAANPLLLALICIVFQRRGSLPQRRADIYRRCVDVLLAEWDASRGKDRFLRFTLEHKEDLLRRVAWRFHESGQRYVPREELIRLIGSFLPMIRLRESDAEAILDEISAFHGLLKDFGHGWYGFHHFTLQEHFAVEHITSWQRLDTAISLRHRSWWREIIRLYAGKGDCTELICRLANEREDLFQSNLFLIGECLTEGSAVAPQLLVHVREELTRIARHQSKPMSSRVRATDLAMRLLPYDDISLTIRWLTDDRVPAAGRLSVVRHMARGLSPALAVALRDLLTSSALDIDLREALATTLAAEAEGEELRNLLARVTREVDTAAQQRLALAIGQAHADQPETLIAIIADEKVSVPLRLGLAVALGQSTRSEVRQALRDLIRTRMDRNVRAAVEVTLFSLGEESVLDALRKTAIDRTVDLWVRREAAGALALRNRAVACEVLQTVVGDAAQERSLRVYAARLLANIAEDAVRLALMDLVRDETADRFVRTAIVEGIGESHAHALTKPLLALLNDPGVLEYVRRAVADALGSLGNPDAVSPLRELWRAAQAEPRVRQRALLALGRIGTEAALREVVGELARRDLDRSLRRSLAETLRPSGTNADAEVLAQACRWLGQTDVPGAMLTVIARFSAEAGKTIYPEDLGMQPVEYAWARQGTW